MVALETVFEAREAKLSKGNTEELMEFVMKVLMKDKLKAA